MVFKPVVSIIGFSDKVTFYEEKAMIAAFSDYQVVAVFPESIFVKTELLYEELLCPNCKYPVIPRNPLIMIGTRPRTAA